MLMRTTMLMSLLAAVLVGCPEDDDPTPAPVADVAVEDTQDVVEDEDVAPPEPDVPPPPTELSGPSATCLTDSCEPVACMAVGECATAAVCVSECDSISCAEACVPQAAPPFRAKVLELVQCGAEKACFAGGSGLDSCGNATCDGPAETMLNCPDDCGIHGNPELVYECMLGSCELGNCPNSNNCSKGLWCIAGCLDRPCVTTCINQASGNARNRLWRIAICAAENQCLPEGAAPKCGDGACETGEDKVTCPDDCGEAGETFWCIADNCAPGFCLNSNGCKNGLFCLADCKDGDCTRACIDAANHWVAGMIEEMTGCAIEAECLPPEAKPSPPPCGNGVCEDFEDFGSCPVDCGGPIAECLLASCDAEACAGAEQCGVAFVCMAECTDVPCAVGCISGQPTENQQLLSEIIDCGSKNDCFKPEEPPPEEDPPPEDPPPEEDPPEEDPPEEDPPDEDPPPEDEPPPDPGE